MTEKQSPTAIRGNKSPAPSLSVQLAAAAKKLETKKPAASNNGLEGWFPYYAGYTEQFAEGIIKAATQGQTLHVLDPWNGSGTTTRAAVGLGHFATGLDINPVTTLVASAKLANPDDASHVLGLATRMAAAANAEEVDRLDPLLAWLPPAAVRHFRTIEARILSELATTKNGGRLDPRINTLPPLSAFLLLALIRSTKTLASVKVSSNPTWTRPAESISRVRGKTLERAWIEQISQMSRELGAHGHPAQQANAGSIRLAASTAIPLADETVDLVVTSPPYCTRIDYAVGSSFELAALGIGEDTVAYRQLRAQAMGTPLSRARQPQEPPTDWPDSVKRLLGSIRIHQSKASGTYYYKTYFQYFSDCLASLREIYRVLHDKGSAVLVVQSSYYKDIYVDLPQLYVDCGQSLGFSANVGATTHVKKALAQINSCSRKHKAKKAYEESVVILERA